MRSRLALPCLIAFASFATACVQGPLAQPAAVPESNISIPQSQIDPDAVEELLGKVEAIRATRDGRGQVSLGEILSFLPITDDERATVLSGHPNPVSVSCSGNLCTAVSNGSQVYVTLSQLDNTPAWFGSTVTLRLRWHGPSHLEICRIQNFQVQKLVWVTVDGAYIDARGGEGSSFVDVSWGGSYPDC